MTKRTLHGSLKKAVKKSGFRSRMSSSTGKKIISARRRRGRKVLAKATKS